MRKHVMIPALLALSVGLAACSHQPNANLESARSNFSSLQSDPQASKVAALETKEAQEWLNKADKAYMDRLMQLSDELGSWILEAQGQGHLNAALPPELVLYTLFARACDPVLGVLRASGAHSDAQIVDWLVTTCFKGLAG